MALTLDDIQRVASALAWPPLMVIKLSDEQIHNAVLSGSMECELNVEKQEGWPSKLIYESRCSILADHYCLAGFTTTVDGSLRVKISGWKFDAKLIANLPMPKGGPASPPSAPAPTPAPPKGTRREVLPFLPKTPVKGPPEPEAA